MALRVDRRAASRVIVIYRLTTGVVTTAVGGTGAAFANAKDIVAAERFLGIYWERSVQQAFLNVDWFIAFWNIYYGTIHFVFPGRHAHAALPQAADAIRALAEHARADVGDRRADVPFVYPLMPPRLMPARYGFVDTAAEYYNFGPQVKVEVGTNGQPTQRALDQFGNPFAAMPSFHVGWSTWCVLALWPLVRRRWLRALLIAYPLAILFCITVTGNHWFLDAVGGWVVLALGWLGAVGFERVGALLRPRRAAAAADA